jgi:hypothetical protein
MSEIMITNSLVKVKDAPPYVPELEVPVLMNSMARATFDVKTGSYRFSNKLTTKPEVDVSNTRPRCLASFSMPEVLRSTLALIKAIRVYFDERRSCSL